MSPAEMPAGRELDAEVAEKVMGLAVSHGVRCLYEHGAAIDIGIADPSIVGALDPVPHYSANIDDAWLVVKEMERRRFSCVVASNALANGKQIGAKFFRGFHGLGWPIFNADEHDGHSAVSDSAPRSICLAALAAVDAADTPDRLAAVRAAETECHAEERADGGDHGR